MGSRVRVVVLCEDKQHFTFALRSLKRLGFESRDVASKYAALGRQNGAGEQFVRENYAAEVLELRRRHAASALLVVIDVDKGSVEHREEQLRMQLRGYDPPQTARKATEPIGHWIPKRNIETWIHFLLGREVSEDAEDPYPKFIDRERECDPAAARFVEMVLGRESPPKKLPSLARAIPETRRLTR